MSGPPAGTVSRSRSRATPRCARRARARLAEAATDEQFVAGCGPPTARRPTARPRRRQQPRRRGRGFPRHRGPRRHAGGGSAAGGRAPGPGAGGPGLRNGRDAVELTVAAGEDWDTVVAGLRRRGPGRPGAPVGHPGLRGGDADPERRRLRPGGRRAHHRGPRYMTANTARWPTWPAPSAGSGTARAPSSGACWRTGARRTGRRDRPVRGAERALPARQGPPVLSRPLRRAGPCPRRHRGRPGTAGRRPLRRAGPAPGQGDGAGPGRPGHQERWLLLPQPGHRPRPARGGRARGARRRRPRCPRPPWPAGDGRVKVPAAWLIEQTGFRKGYPAAGGPGPGSRPSTRWPWSTRVEPPPPACWRWPGRSGTASARRSGWSWPASRSWSAPCSERWRAGPGRRGALSTSASPPGPPARRHTRSSRAGSRDPPGWRPGPI